jgi:hypothetical protein
MMISANSLLLAVSTRPMVSVIGRKPIWVRTMFTIAGFARARGSGDYGNCRASQAAFTSGRWGRTKANRITIARKSPRQSKQLREFCRGHPPSPQLRRTGPPRLQLLLACGTSMPGLLARTSTSGAVPVKFVWQGDGPERIHRKVLASRRFFVRNSQSSICGSPKLSAGDHKNSLFFAPTFHRCR